MSASPSNSSPRPAILSIAGFDPTNGAGILADAAVFRALGFHPLTVLTSVAAQGAKQVTHIQPLSGELLIRQLEIVTAEFKPAAIKIGMIYSLEAVQVVAAFIRTAKVPVVLDPVMKSTSGGDLVQPEALPLMEGLIIPACRLVTPNLKEAGYFLGREIGSLQEAEEAAQELTWLWNTAVLIKGGHLEGDPVDILAENNDIIRFPHSPYAVASSSL